MRVRVIAMTLICSLGMSCRHQVRLGEVEVQKNGPLAIWATHIKDKRRKYDLTFMLRNNTSSPLVVRKNSLSCFRGQTIGELKFIRGDYDDEFIHLFPGQQHRFVVVCKTGRGIRGNYKLSIDKVLVPGKPDRTGRRPLMVVGKNVVWVTRDA